MKKPSLWAAKGRWQPLSVRFARSYAVNSAGCWIWSGHKNRQGYGHFQWKRDNREFNWMAHRASWRIHRGRIPEGLQVLHRCDVPSCVNPAHLFLGTQKENMDDMVQKGRDRRREGGRPFTFDDEVMRVAVESSEPAAIIAKRLGLHRSTVHRWRQLARQD